MGGLSEPYPAEKLMKLWYTERAEVVLYHRSKKTTRSVGRYLPYHVSTDLVEGIGGDIKGTVT